MHARAQFNIATDSLDTRDYAYRPALVPLGQEFICAALDAGLGNGVAPVGLPKIRNQGSGPTCVGEALASLIDIQRLEMNRAEIQAGKCPVVAPVSSAMLYQMARSLDEAPARGPGVFSLRSVLKGFYNCGVCLEESWLQDDPRTFDQMSPAAAEQARELCLGAYYRVSNVLNDYHSALHEAGALLVSASIHDGWRQPANGIIDQNGGGRALGHAFVVVGYTAKGFLVLNSFGPDWGGYDHRGYKIPGVALWSYEDWAGSARDAWVLRLGVSVPGAFRYTIGSYGKPAGIAQEQAEPTGSDGPRRNAVIGRYLTFDDGRFQTTGLYPTTPQTMETTLSILRNRTIHGVGTPYYGDVLLVFHGSPDRASDILERLERSIVADKADGIYRIAILWCNGLLEGTAAALTPLFAEAMLRTGGPGPDCDNRIETLTRPIGRAVWRDLKRQASQLTSGSKGKGDLARAVAAIADMCIETGRRLHVLCEGAGVHALAGLVEAMESAKRERTAFCSVLSTVQCLAPLIGAKHFKTVFEPFLLQWKSVLPSAEITVIRPDRSFEAALGVFPYSKSWSHLVQTAFEDDGDPLMSLDTTACALRDGGLRSYALPVPGAGPLGLQSLFQHPVAETRIRWHIKDSVSARRGKGKGPFARHDVSQEPAAPSVPPDGAKPTGRSLHIGVNRLSEGVYGALEPLKGCVNDAELWATIAGERGYQTQRLIDEAATREAVGKALEEIARSTRPGDIFLLTYSGHGNTATDVDGDEGEGRYDSTWCLHDGELTDDAFVQYWQQFPAGARVVMISDSCHSGSIVAASNPLRSSSAAAGLGMSRRLPPKAERKLAVDRSRKRQGNRTTVTPGVTGRGEGRQSDGSVQASIRLISACADEELAYETAGSRVHGALTKALTDAVTVGFDGTFDDLAPLLIEQLGAVQTPGQMSIGRRDAAFDLQAVLSIAPDPAPVRKTPGRQAALSAARLTSRGIVTVDRLGLRFIPPGRFDLGRLDGSPDGELGDLVRAHETALATLAAAVGRVRSGSVLGTAFLVAPDLVMTNNHVAASFADPRDWSRVGQPTFEFDGEIVGLDTSGPFAVVGPVDVPNPTGRFDPGKLDIALVRLAAPLIGRMLPPLAISAQVRAGDPIAAIGFPAAPGSPGEEPAARRVFGPDYKASRWLSPGRLTQPPGSRIGTDGPADPAGWIVQHDASVLGGSSGSMIVDMLSGAVVAIHFGTFLNRRNRPETNYAHVLPAAFERRRDLLRTIDDANRRYGRPTPLV